MTMEMWQLGFHMARLPLALFIVVMIPVLIGLEYYTGFKDATTLLDEVADAATAYGVGLVASALVLALFNIISLDEPLSSVIGKVALQAVPASFGAMLANSLFGIQNAAERRHKREVGFGGTLFLMAVGSLFLAFNVAPTEEMILIAYVMTPWHALALVVVSIMVLHAFVYSLEFSGQEDRPGGDGFWRSFWGYSLAGYGIALVVSLYVLWTFGRTDGVAPGQVAMMVTVLGFPSALGAAIARLVV